MVWPRDISAAPRVGRCPTAEIGISLSQCCPVALGKTMWTEQRAEGTRERTAACTQWEQRLQQDQALTGTQYHHCHLTAGDGFSDCGLPRLLAADLVTHRLVLTCKTKCACFGDPENSNSKQWSSSGPLHWIPSYGLWTSASGYNSYHTSRAKWLLPFPMSKISLPD